MRSWIEAGLSLIPVLIVLVGPKDALLRQLWHKQPLKLWHLESACVGSFLALVVVISNHFHVSDSTLEWNGWAALMLAHGRNSVMFRMIEAQNRLAAKADPELVKAQVACWKWADFYFYLSEAFWARYFFRHDAWAALAGVVVFVTYARWRKWYVGRQVH